MTRLAAIWRLDSRRINGAADGDCFGSNRNGVRNRYYGNQTIGFGN